MKIQIFMDGDATLDLKGQAEVDLLLEVLNRAGDSFRDEIKLVDFEGEFEKEEELRAKADAVEDLALSIFQKRVRV